MSRDWKLLTSLFLLALVMYVPVLGKGFASDDFEVMYRVVNDRIFYLIGFFRPLSDLSLYACYLIGGYDGWIYNLLNIILHAFSGFFLYKTALLLFEGKVRSPGAAAVLAAVLFVIFPFHNESVVWIVGRASNLSCFLGFWALYLALTVNPTFKWACIVGLLYFASLSTYETTITLPGIVVLLNIYLYPGQRRWLKWMVVFLLAIILNIVVRLSLSEELVGDYGARIFDPSVTNNLIKISKTWGRLFLPPLESSSTMVILLLVIMLVLGWLIWRLFKVVPEYRRSFLLLAGSLFLACGVPFLFGVSTRTIEGDRLLYFPSYFLCLVLACLLTVVFNKRNLYPAFACLVVYYSVCLQLNNFTWRKADAITQSILMDMSRLRPQFSQALLLNLPEEYKGAHVFRNGFEEALLLQSIDTTGIVIGSFQGFSEQTDLTKKIVPVEDSSDIRWFGPTSGIRQGTWLITIDKLSGEKREQPIDSNLPVIYWNNRNMVFFR